MYFKSFHHAPTNHTFNDGGIKFNNPAALANEERKLIWPESRARDPDILLSIGTGFDSSIGVQTQEPGPRARIGVRGFAKKMLGIAVDTLQDVLDCEKSWTNFLESVHGNDEDRQHVGIDAERQQNYFRLNPDLKGKFTTLPKLDDVKAIDMLERYTSYIFQTSTKLRSVAATLISSLLYFEWDCMRKDGEYNGSIRMEGADLTLK